MHVINCRRLTCFPVLFPNFLPFLRFLVVCLFIPQIRVSIYTEHHHFANETPSSQPYKQADTIVASHPNPNQTRPIRLFPSPYPAAGHPFTLLLLVQTIKLAQIFCITFSLQKYKVPIVLSISSLRHCSKGLLPNLMDPSSCSAKK